MTAGLIGLALGAVAGFISWRTLKALAERVDLPETKRVLGIVGIVELVLLPVIGFVVAELAFGDRIGDVQ